MGKGDKTRPIGKGSANLSVNVPKWLHRELTQLAKDSGISLGDFVRPILVKAAQDKARVHYEIVIERFISSESKEDPKAAAGGLIAGAVSEFENQKKQKPP
jgi:hypothetical protein